MNDFITKLTEISKNFDQLKEDEKALAHRTNIANLELQALLKDAGLPENFSLPEALLLAVKKSQ